MSLYVLMRLLESAPALSVSANPVVMRRCC